MSVFFISSYVIIVFNKGVTEVDVCVAGPGHHLLVPALHGGVVVSEGAGPQVHLSLRPLPVQRRQRGPIQVGLLRTKVVPALSARW